MNLSQLKLATKRFASKGHLWLIARALLIVGVLVAVVLWLQQGPALRVVKVTPATTLDDQFQPVKSTDRVGPHDTFFVSVELRDYRPDMKITARWRYEGTTINETVLKTSDIGNGYAGFSLINDRPPWPAGNYVVEIVYNDKVLGSAPFRVHR